MEKTVQKIPFLRLTLALAFGILIGSFTEISVLLLCGFCILTCLFLIILNQNYKFKFVPIFGIFSQILLILIGILVFDFYNKKQAFPEKGIYIATILEKPQEKKNSYKLLVQISSVEERDTIFQTKEKVLVYFEKNENSLKLNPGDNIIFKTSPQLIKNYGNPYEFDYKKYLSNKRIYRQVYLSSENWKTTNFTTRFSIIIFAENIREKLLKIYRQQKLGKNEIEILSALTLGYKHGLDPETKRVFSVAGAMHILAVSGLHVGIIFWVITLLFGFLRKQKTGKILFVVLTVCLLWSYAFITGLSPSVMRAAAMFTIFVIGDNLNRKANTYNSLAASALFLLLFNPNNLFEVGFQLSYSAVFGIVFLQPKLSKLIPVNNKIVKFFWTLLTVSVAAQIATFPLTIFYFNQFPTYFWITNLIIIPAAMVLIPLGIGLLIFFKIPLISNLIATTIQFLINGSYIVLSKIEQLPYSIQEISLRPIELIFLMGVLLSFYLLIQNFNARYLKTTLTFTLFLLVSLFITNYIQSKSREIIVYNSPQNESIQLISGKRNYVISEQKFEEGENIFNLIKQTNRKLKLNSSIYLTRGDTFIDDFLYSGNGLILFEGKKIIFQKSISTLAKTITPDIVINPKQLSELESLISKNTIIITNKRLYPKKSLSINHIHLTSKHGAFLEKW